MKGFNLRLPHNQISTQLQEKTMKKKISLSIWTCLLAFAFILVACEEPKAAKTGPVVKNSKFNETALFIAGEKLPAGSELLKYTKKGFYKRYAANLDRGWNKFQNPNMKKIVKWWDKKAPAQYSKNILYPFSGPDIMNALTFYPDAENITMFGLEEPGIIPDPFTISETELKKNLGKIEKSLRTIMVYNFFRTKGMEVNIDNSSFSGVTGIVLFFLGKNGYEVLDIQKIVLDKSSEIIKAQAKDNKIDWMNPPYSRIPGVKISFKKNNGKVKTVRYFMLNIADSALVKHSPNFLPFIKENGPYSTIIKSASYLLHKDNKKDSPAHFSKIRKMILDNSNFIIQDDSGIPLKYYNDGKWNVNLHGEYIKPVSLWPHRYQKDMKEAYKKKSTGRLPFSYGYNYKSSNLQTLEKK